MLYHYCCYLPLYSILKAQISIIPHAVWATVRVNPLLFGVAPARDIVWGGERRGKACVLNIAGREGTVKVSSLIADCALSDLAFIRVFSGLYFPGCWLLFLYPFSTRTQIHSFLSPTNLIQHPILKSNKLNPTPFSMVQET